MLILYQSLESFFRHIILIYIFYCFLLSLCFWPMLRHIWHFIRLWFFLLHVSSPSINFIPRPFLFSEPFHLLDLLLGLSQWLPFFPLVIFQFLFFFPFFIVFFLFCALGSLVELNLFHILLLERQRYCTEIVWSICPRSSIILVLILLLPFLLIIVIFLQYSLVALQYLVRVLCVTGQF